MSGPPALPLPLAVAGHELRPFAAADIPRLVALADDLEVWRQLTDLFPRPYTVEAAERWIGDQRELDPPQNLVIAGPEGLLGGIGVILASVPNYAHDGELGYWLGRPAWGRGLMTAAVQAFLPWAAEAHGLARFTARLYASNARSRCVLERCGFAHEGTLRAAVRKEGRVQDLLVYGLLMPAPPA